MIDSNKVPLEVIAKALAELNPKNEDLDLLCSTTAEILNRKTDIPQSMQLKEKDYPYRIKIAYEEPFFKNHILRALQEASPPRYVTDSKLFKLFKKEAYETTRAITIYLPQGHLFVTLSSDEYATNLNAQRHSLPEINFVPKEILREIYANIAKDTEVKCITHECIGRFYVEFSPPITPEHIIEQFYRLEKAGAKAIKAVKYISEEKDLFVKRVLKATRK